jgi:hypothetical protein
VLSARTGALLFSDQTPDLNQVFGLGLGKPHHASMNGGTVIADGMVFVPSGAQNNPSGGILAYEINERPFARNDWARVRPGQSILIDALSNDSDPNGDALQFTRVAGSEIDTGDGQPDVLHRHYGTIIVVNPGDDPQQPEAGYIRFRASQRFRGVQWIRYTVEDLPPNLIVNGLELNEANPTHTPRTADARIQLVATTR